MPAITAPLSLTGLGRLNPAAKLLSATVVMVGLLTTVDLVTVSVVLGAELVALLCARVPLEPLAARAWPLSLAAAGVALANVVASDAGPATIAAVSLRLVAIALPGILLFASTDAVDLADSLVQQLRVPARLAYGSLAALRLLPLLGQEWVAIRRARRARGMDAGHSPLRAALLFMSAVYALLVSAIRRGTRLAMAMDSKGFDSGAPRTSARRQSVTPRDWLLAGAVTGVVAGANLLAVLLGTWHPLLG